MCEDASDQPGSRAREPQPSHSVSQLARHLCPEVSTRGPPGLLSPVSQYIQSGRTVLGHSGDLLEWGYLRHGGDGHQVCSEHDLEWPSPSGSLTHHYLSHWCPLI